MSEEPLRIGVIGLGFIGEIHIDAYRRAEADGHGCRLAAVCDARPERLTGERERRGNIDAGGEGPLFDPERVKAYTDPARFIADDEIDAVSICTTTESHVPIAVAALEAGKHVLVEKPLALRVEETAPLEAAVAETDRVILPAHCVRFWPGWSWLAGVIDEQRYGGVLSARFHRLSGLPTWSPLYLNPGVCGGALVDLHVHDADFVRACFGDPVSVSTFGHRNHALTVYRYPRAPFLVTAEGGWLDVEGFGFRMQYHVVFEDAEASYDSRRESPLQLTLGGVTESQPLEETTGYDEEVRHFLDVIAGKAEPRVTLSDAVAVTRLLEAEGESLASGEAVLLSP